MYFCTVFLVLYFIYYSIYFCTTSILFNVCFIRFGVWDDSWFMFLYILRYSKKEASERLEKLLLSAIANWQNKNEDLDVEEANLYVKEIYVDSARQLKRLRPAPQGRAHRIRKRSNHVTIVLGSKTEENQ